MLVVHHRNGQILAVEQHTALTRADTPVGDGCGGLFT